MNVTIRRPVTKRCPYKNETDHGTLELTWDNIESDIPELHELAARIDEMNDMPLSHEAWTHRIANLVPDATIISHWHTGPWTVQCST